ncbi:MAG: hypothetical protein U1E87_04085 [Alphaproteobacteria bacterium]
MLGQFILSFAIPLVLTLLAPGVRFFLAAVTQAGAIGWQDFAFWQAANSEDFVGPPALPITAGAVSVAAAGLMIGAFTRLTAIGLIAAKVKLAMPHHLALSPRSARSSAPLIGWLDPL